ncbi:MAG: response regulator [Candidatus Omnitrophota bacterium]
MPKKILVVDDEQDVRQFSKSRLEQFGYSVVTAENGREGLEKVRSEKPHLILLDVNMPVLGGFDMFNELRLDPAHRDIPVIMVTVASQGKDIRKGMDLGAVTYLTKPFNMDVLLGLVQGFLGGEESIK